MDSPLNQCQQLDKRALHEQVMELDASRQQRKIIAYFVREGFDLSKHHDVQIADEERSRFFQMIRDGRIGEEQYRTFLSSISLPQREPQNIFQQISFDHQKKGIIAGILGDFNKRDSLGIDGISSFIRLYPHPIDYESAVKQLLDIVESNNERKKRQEYEKKADEVGRLLYGKQWEYLRGIRSLEEQARSVVQDKQEGRMKVNDEKEIGIKQSKEYLENHRIEGLIYDGFCDGGRNSMVYEDGRIAHSDREIIVVDRSRDDELNALISQAKRMAEEIRRRQGSEEEVIFSIARLVYERMHAPDAEIKVSQLPVNQEVLLGSIRPGVCRHRSLLFQVLASEVGIESAIVRGFYNDGRISGVHAWNEVKIRLKNGSYKTFLVDVSLTNFSRLDSFQEFINSDGFTDILIKRQPTYFDIQNRSLY